MKNVRPILTSIWGLGWVKSFRIGYDCAYMLSPKTPEFQRHIYYCSSDVLRKTDRKDQKTKRLILFLHNIFEVKLNAVFSPGMVAR